MRKLFIIAYIATIAMSVSSCDSVIKASALCNDHLLNLKVVTIGNFSKKKSHKTLLLK